LKRGYLKVVHITPTFFDESSIIGGGERYPTELSARMAESVDTTLVSFSSRRRSYKQGKLKIVVYPVRRFIHGNRVNPLCLRYLSALREVDVVHVHHIHTLISDMACLSASLLGKRAFVTDYGGGGSLVLNQKLPVFKHYHRAFVYSRYGARFLPTQLKDRAVLVKGGIDTVRFCPDPTLAREKKILYVGRILPHKGINYLIEAFRLLNRSDFTLRIVGRVYSESFYQYLKRLAEGLRVEFVHDADDDRLLQEYRTSLVTVLPSVHTSYDGKHTHVPELMGFTLLESQACATPVICTDAGAMSEFVEEEKSGLIVKQNSADALAAALRQIAHASPSQFAQYGMKCREWVGQFDWSSVVRAHLQVYEEAAGRRARSRAA
jgi:glycosyltransferase involved in cell wall biosynthesis